MSVLIFVGIPVGWAILAKALGWAIAAAFFYSDNGKRAGQRIGRWCLLLAPTLVLGALIAGVDGNAGSGIRLFGSEWLLGLLFAIPFWAIPALLLFAGAVYVARDLTLGHTKPCEVKAAGPT